MDDAEAMGLALASAREALKFGEVPIGAVIVRDCDDKILATAFNLRETRQDPTAHAERLALTIAGEALGSWRLEGCSLYVTLEPCAMCAGAIVLSRIDRVVYGAADPKAGACRSLYRLLDDPRLNHRPLVQYGLREGEARALLTDFFLGRRLAAESNPRRGA
ncbi:MAG: nucleoside deaminase [Isosphaeraceae bacterium]